MVRAIATARNERMILALAVFCGGFLRFRERQLRGFVSLIGVLHGEPRLLMPAHMILFAVMGGGGAMRVRRHFVEFSGATVISVRHIVLLETENGYSSAVSDHSLHKMQRTFKLATNYVSSTL
jgi:hypothetical protein